MIKAVFFDWFHTLARFEPPREGLHRRAYQEFGIKIPPEKLTRGLLLADKDWFEATSRLSLEKQSPKERLELALRYQEIALTQAGATVPREGLLKIVKRSGCSWCPAGRYHPDTD